LLRAKTIDFFLLFYTNNINYCMKQYYFLLLFCVFSLHTHAQFTQNWKKLANATDFAWFTNDNNVTSLDFNPVTGKLLVSKRNDRVFVLNPNTGAQEDTIISRGGAIGTENFKFNKIRVASDGAIYGISLATGAGTARIYRWGSQTEAPTLAATFTVTERCGDAFGLSGSGANTVLYASGSGTTANAFNIYILSTTDGRNFTLDSKVTMTSAPTTNQQWANRTVEPEGTGVNAPIWIKGGGFVARKIAVGPKNANNVRTGTVVATVPDGVTAGQASIGYGGMRMLTTTNSGKFLAFSGGNNGFAGTKLNVITVQRDTVFDLFGRDSLSPVTAYIANGNATGDVAFRVNADRTFTAFYLSTNNGIAAATSSVLTSTKNVEPADFNAKVLGNPVQDELKVQINAETSRTVFVSAYDAQGRLLTTQKMSMSRGLNQLSLPADTWPVGLIWVDIRSDRGRQTLSVIKQ
jgi:hypothetical protein